MLETLSMWMFWIGIAILFFFGTTYLIKRSGKAQTFYVLSILKTTKFIPWLDKAQVFGILLDIFSRIGLVMGFGAFAVDYMYGRSLKIWARIPLFIISSTFLYFFYLRFFEFLLVNPYVKEYSLVLSLSFAFFGFAGFLVASLATYAAYILRSIPAGEQVCPGVAPLIPGIEIPNVPIVVPLHAWLSLLFILVLHEGMHGVMLKRLGFKIKSGGLLLLGLLPIGAFVEPDENELKRAEPMKALKVFAAGPTANLFTMFVLLVIGVALLFAVYRPFIAPWENSIKLEGYEGVVISKVDMNFNMCGKIYESPAYGKLEEGMILLKVDDANIISATQAAALIENKSRNGLPVMLTVKDASGKIETFELKPVGEFNYLGFQIMDKMKEDYVQPQNYVIYNSFLSIIGSFINWFFILSLLVAVVNFLPLDPFDGGRIIKIMAVPYLGFLNKSQEETEKLIGKILFWLLIALLVINAMPLLL